ncbi:MAG TPA: CBS domain-containing protein [Kiritimatiellia bacterium]|nr:CBS domain-containing protein [Kiritimatiellia bacterium]
MNPIPISAEQSPLLFLELLYKLRVRDVMASDLVTIRRDATMRDLQRLMQARRVSGVPVVEDKRLFGIVSIEDLLQALDTQRMNEPVARFMATNVVTVEDDMPLSIVLSYFTKYEYRRFPVLNAHNEAVGIITARSINARLLLELFRELARIENQYVIPLPENASCHFKTFRVLRADFENAGQAATEIKNTLQKRGLDPKIIRRVAIAAYELEMNLVVHSDGGTLTFRVDEGEIQIIAKDRGPGIADVGLALQEGWTTANEWVKSLGFGAGMGLPNARRVSDEFHIVSEPGMGTTVTIRDVIPPRAPPQNPPA